MVMVNGCGEPLSFILSCSLINLNWVFVVDSFNKYFRFTTTMKHKIIIILIAKKKIIVKQYFTDKSWFFHSNILKVQVFFWNCWKYRIWNNNIYSKSNVKAAHVLFSFIGYCCDIFRLFVCSGTIHHFFHIFSNLYTIVLGFPVSKKVQISFHLIQSFEPLFRSFFIIFLSYFVSLPFNIIKKDVYSVAEKMCLKWLLQSAVYI